MSLRRLNRLIALIQKRLGLTEEQALDFICDAAFDKQRTMPAVGSKTPGNHKGDSYGS